MLGTKNLGDILSERESIASEMHDLLEEATDSWGVTVERVELKDVRVPEQLMRAMAAEAEAAREARAKIIAAEGEEKASTSLRNAANIISENKGALQVRHLHTGQNVQKSQTSYFVQLRYLQTLNNISAENNSTIVFPVPVDVLHSVMNHVLPVDT